MVFALVRAEQTAMLALEQVGLQVPVRVDERLVIGNWACWICHHQRPPHRTDP